MRTLLLLAMLWPTILAAEADPEALRTEFRNLAERIQRQAGDLARVATLCGLLEPSAALLERLRGARDQATALADAILKEQGADAAQATALRQRAVQLEAAVSRVTGEMQTLSNAPAHRGQPDARSQPYLDQLRTQILALLADATAGREGDDQRPVVARRRELLLFALQLIADEQMLPVRRPNLTRSEPPLADYLAWAQGERARLDAALVAPLPPAGEERRLHLSRESDALARAQGMNQHWSELLALVDSRRTCDLPPSSAADGPGLPLLRMVLERLADHRRKVIALHAKGEPTNQEDHGRLWEGFEELREQMPAAEAAITWQREFAAAAANLMEELAKCPEEVRKGFRERIDQLAAEALKCQARQLEAVIARERVAAAEAEGELTLISTRLESLAQEAGSQASLADGEAAWRAQEKAPALAEPLKRHRELRGKLADAHAKQLKQQLALQQVRNRIVMLQLKEELMSNQASAAEEALHRVRGALDELQQELENAATEAKEGKGGKDAQDAERIPLIKPGVDDF